MFGAILQFALKNKGAIVAVILFLIAFVKITAIINENSRLEGKVDTQAVEIQSLNTKVANKEAQLKALNKSVSDLQERNYKLSASISKYERDAVIKRSELQSLKERYKKLAKQNPKQATEEIIKTYNSTVHNLSCITGGIECTE